MFIDKVITLQSQKRWSKSDRNNVRFLPVTATYKIILAEHQLMFAVNLTIKAVVLVTTTWSLLSFLFMA